MNLLKTTFYDEFACIGAECPLTCCGGWKIEMEEKTLKERLEDLPEKV
jgi:lysine-N-methylase